MTPRVKREETTATIQRVQVEAAGSDESRSDAKNEKKEISKKTKRNNQTELEWETYIRNYSSNRLCTQVMYTCVRREGDRMLKLLIVHVTTIATTYPHYNKTAKCCN